MKKLINQFLCSRMILPEHWEELSRHYCRQKEEDDKNFPFDEQELELWEGLIKQSLDSGKEIRLSFRANNKTAMIAGTVIKVDPDAGRIIMAAQDGRVVVPARKIVSVGE